MSSNYRNNPDLWRSIYDPFAKAFGPDNVIIAGGAVRDYTISNMGLGSPEPKDIDVFIRTDSNIQFELAVNEIRELPFWVNAASADGFDIVRDKGDDGRYEFSASDEIDNTWVGQAMGYNEWQFEGSEMRRVTETLNLPPRSYGYQLNVIGRTDVDASDVGSVENFVRKFDYNICRAYYNPYDNTSVALEECMKDIEGRTITYGLETKPTPKNIERGRRFLNRLYDLDRKFKLVGLPKESRAKMKKPAVRLSPMSEIVMTRAATENLAALHARIDRDRERTQTVWQALQRNAATGELIIDLEP